MYKIDQIKSMFNCKICSDLLLDPITIPCGDTVCNSHLNDHILKQTFECQCCKKKHSVPNEGFVINKFIQNQLKMQLNSMDVNQVFEECKDEIESAHKSVDQINKMEQDSQSYIYNYFEDIKRQIDLRREVLKEDIDKYSDKVIQSINETRNNYIKLSKEENDLRTNIENSKKELDELIKKFDTLKIDEKKFHDIKANVVALRHKFDKNLIGLKSSLIGCKEYSFIYNEQLIEYIFGIFSEKVFLLFLY